MRTSLTLAATLVLFTASGCTLYFGGGDDDDPCLWGGGGGAAEEPGAPLDLRDPYTGECVYFGDGGWGGCDDACGPCATDPQPGGGAAAPMPSWGYCESYCSGLGESQCLATPGCRGAYVESCIESLPFPCDANADPFFFECWATDQSGPVQGSCENLDAFECSRHDDCIAIHQDLCDSEPLPGDGEGGMQIPFACGTGAFLSCAPEKTGCYSDAECGPGTHCTADTECLPPPGCEMDPMGDPSTDPLPPGGISGCDAVCYGSCVADGPSTCWDEVYCLAPVPLCPPDMVPAIKDNCYTGECIPLSSCEMPPPPPPACSQLGEQECIYSSYCGPVYTGIDCSCDANGCSCGGWQFHTCIDLGE